jgi:hypothetical protein
MAITHSSVLIIPEQAGQELQYSIVPIEGQASAAVGEQRTDESVYRIGVWTGPFGRTYQLTVNGYVPITIDVFPLFGKIVRVGQDMDKSPTLLLRPWIGALRSLRNNGTFKLWRILLKGERQLIADARGHDGSFLVGWEQVVSRNYISDWRSELIATSGSREPEVLERTILSWRNLKHIVPMSQNQKIYFKPGEKLEAEVYSRADVLVAKVSITVSNQTLQDVVIEDIERDSGSS